MLIPLLVLFSLPAPSFDIKDGDRIVMVGGALVEREQQFGQVELLLHMTHKDKKFTVRNLGWSGDTVWGEARAGFGTQADGYRTLVEQVKAAKPTLLILGYGTCEAFAGKPGVEKFEKQYRQLLADIATPETRCIFLTIPTPVAAKVSPTFSQAEYDAVIKTLAKERGALLVDLHDVYQPNKNNVTKQQPPKTDDGILPNDLGYQELAGKIITAVIVAEGRNAAGPPGIVLIPADNPPRDWTPVTKLIKRKDELYFHQYRPQNNTYLFLFRKHEQGNNAKEIPQFEPLIAELDKQINEMKGKLPPK
ncbi:MAG: hypothetical protein JNJ77_07405 [Planctomycetia bacterium]|nr:hypothetical protein [Planctomycetia bacterium]